MFPSEMGPSDSMPTFESSPRQSSTITGPRLHIRGELGYLEKSLKEGLFGTTRMGGLGGVCGFRGGSCCKYGGCIGYLTHA